MESHFKAYPHELQKYVPFQFPYYNVDTPDYTFHSGDTPGICISR